jgi:prepilin-type N-terminal cleavage/methylation domain-containing protein
MKQIPKGFTLIELAIVLVIIGLLLGGVLKGQELINSAKVKNMANDFKNTQIVLYGYQDKFKALPGDDANVLSHVSNGVLATTPGAVGNAQIEGLWNSDTVTDEPYLFWQHVRLSGLAPGPTTIGGAVYVPRNAEGGRLGIQSIGGSTPFTLITEMTGAFVVCSDGIVGKLAKQLDVTLDDGETSTGSVRAIASGVPGAGVASIAIIDSNLHTVCMTF